MTPIDDKMAAHIEHFLLVHVHVDLNGKISVGQILNSIYWEKSTQCFVIFSFFKDLQFLSWAADILESFWSHGIRIKLYVGVAINRGDLQCSMPSTDYQREAILSYKLSAEKTYSQLDTLQAAWDLGMADMNVETILFPHTHKILSNALNVAEKYGLAPSSACKWTKGTNISTCRLKTKNLLTFFPMILCQTGLPLTSYGVRSVFWFACTTLHVCFISVTLQRKVFLAFLRET